MEDKIFAKPIKKQFEFDEEVAAVFDDMIGRSVPFYQEVQKLVRSLVIANVPKGGLVYDLGSSTGSTLIDLWLHNKNLKLVGLDSSPAMIERARHKAKAFGAQVEFVKADILEYDFMPCDAFIANYTLQFIRPLRRDRFVKKLYESLVDGGIFIFSEKIISPHKRLNKQLIDIYHDFKKDQGYSDFEIAQKREALEHVLVPYTPAENEQMLKEAGFGYVEMIFRWANFATFVAIK